MGAFHIYGRSLPSVTVATKLLLLLPVLVILLVMAIRIFFLFFKSFKKVVFLNGQAFPPPTLMARPLVEELFSAAFLTNLLLRL